MTSGEEACLESEQYPHAVNISKRENPAIPMSPEAKVAVRARLSDQDESRLLAKVSL